MTISGLSGLPSSGFSLVSPPTMPLVIAPAQNTSLVVRFNPTALVNYSASLQIASDAMNQPSLTIPLSGSGSNGGVGGSGKVQALPVTLDFGPILTGTTKNLPLTIKNVGTGTLQVTGITGLTFPGSAFSLVSPPTFPFTIAAGQSAVATVKFAPQVKGTIKTNLVIRSNDPTAPMLTVPIKGYGAFPLEITSPVSAQYPNGLVTGQKLTVRWCPGNVTGNIKITLYRVYADGSRQWMRTMTGTPPAGVPATTGQWAWTLPSIPAGNYQLGAKGIDNESIKDFSDTFKVTVSTSQPWIKVTQPGTPVTWKIGQKVRVTWTSAKVTGAIKLNLYDGEISKAKISPDNQVIDVSKGYFDWTIPTTVYPKANLVVRVKSVTNSGLKDASAYITIVK